MATDRPRRVVVTDHTFVHTAYEEEVARRHGCHFEVHAAASETEAHEAVTDADVVFVNFAPMSREVLAAMSPGATVIRYGVGYDNVDLTAAAELGIQVANVPDYGVDTVADHAVASMLMLARRLPMYDSLIRSNGWARPAEVGPLQGVSSLTVGLLGFGRIAQEVARRLAPFGCTVIAHDPFGSPEAMLAADVERVDLDELTTRSNAVSLHAPVTDTTFEMVNAAFLAAMPDGAIVVNTSRGGLIDEHALAAALRSGRLAAAALDVTQVEPWPEDSPLRDAPNLVLSPHAAFYSVESLDSLQRLAGEEADRALRGERLRCPVTTPLTSGATA